MHEGSGGMREIEVRELALARSGEKGDDVNVAVVALDPAAYDLLRERLTAEVVGGLYGPLVRGGVERYEAPNVCGLNFVLRGALGGGRSRTLAFDESGKALASVVLRHRIAVPDDYRPPARPG
jgi:hypothetical protein